MILSLNKNIAFNKITDAMPG